MHTDHLLRRVLAVPANAASLLRHLLRDHPLGAIVDWSSLALASTVRVDGTLRRHEADFVFLARSLDGRIFLLFVLEHTSGRRRRVGKQVLRYVLHALSTFEERNPGQPWPVVVPILLHTGKHALSERLWLASASTPSRIGRDNAGFAYGILVDELAGVPEDELRSRDLLPPVLLALLFAQFVAGRSPTEVEAALRRWSELLRRLVHPPGDLGELEVFQSYVLETTTMSLEHLERVLREVLGPDGEATMQSTADRLREEGRLEGRASGLAEGKAEGKAELLLSLLHRRFGRAASGCADRIRAASPAELDRLALRVLDCAALDEVFAD